MLSFLFLSPAATQLKLLIKLKRVSGNLMHLHLTVSLTSFCFSDTCIILPYFGTETINTAS